MGYTGKAVKVRLFRHARRKKGGTRMKRYRKEEGERPCRRLKWDDINKLDLWMLQNMGEDGYLFEVNDGRIRNILMSTACAA